MARKIVVTSGKGGVGKTTVTACLGGALADAGRKVVLIDADIGLNNLDVVLGIENKVVYDILDVIKCRCRIKQALVRDFDRPELFVLPSAKLSDSPPITAQAFRNIVSSLDKYFDYVIIDCPAGIDNGFHRAVSGAEQALVVTTPSVSAIRDADKVFNLLGGYSLSSADLVVNRIRHDMVRRGEMMSAGDISRLLRAPVAGIIPEDDNVSLYSGIGRLPVNSASATAFYDLARSVETGQPCLGEGASYRRESLFGRLKRIFR